ncbi:putative gag protein [Cucumis melo var. makuwa]|uniref:Gag protein n=1 Tax=Cucumis melo var. makuwa TaxID=1194695 RepID=A0A5A7V269_CUCMM|nr:putative gag protein [Cucumis melo var. makuwa]
MGKETLPVGRQRKRPLLDNKKTLKAIMDPKELPKTVTKEQMEEMESAPYGTIVLYLSDNVLTEIIDKETTYEIWVKLEEMYLTRDLSNRAYLGEKFFTYNMDSNESLTDTLSEFKKLSTEFQSLGDQIDEENETFFLLNSLSDEYREVNVALK